jgi:hypothetical protein
MMADIRIVHRAPIIMYPASCIQQIKTKKQHDHQISGIR